MPVTPQMLLLSLMHTLENILHLVQPSLLFTAMDGRLGLLPAHTPPHPLVECLMLPEFAAKEKLLQVSHMYVVHLYSLLST